MGPHPGKNITGTLRACLSAATCSSANLTDRQHRLARPSWRPGGCRDSDSKAAVASITKSLRSRSPHGGASRHAPASSAPAHQALLDGPARTRVPPAHAAERSARRGIAGAAAFRVGRRQLVTGQVIAATADSRERCESGDSLGRLSLLFSPRRSTVDARCSGFGIDPSFTGGGWNEAEYG